jgi:hypothetical protein
MHRLTRLVAVVLLIQSPAHVAPDSGGVREEWVMTMVRRHLRDVSFREPVAHDTARSAAAKRGLCWNRSRTSAASRHASWIWS